MADRQGTLDGPARAVLDDSTALLERWRRGHAGRPDEERIKLLLLALEREQIVSVAYREDVLAARIGRLGLPDDAAALVRRALLWAWKDEQLHTEYVRGLLLGSRRPVPAAVVAGRQVVGTISGWVTAVRHHHDPAEAPMRTAAAGVLVLAARLTRRIPAALADELRFRSLRRYLLLNVVLERTAELAYLRLAEVARAVGDDDEAETFTRIATDEAGHGSAFALLADALDGDDRWTGPTEAVAAALRDVSPWFVALDRRRPGPSGRSGPPGRSATDGGLGSGAPVHVRAAAPGTADPTATTAAVLSDVGLDRLVAPGSRVAIRTAFMYGYDRRDRSNVVDPRIVRAVAAAARTAGADDVAVLEARTVYGRWFAHRSVAEVAAYFGYGDEAYRVVDIDADLDPWTYERGLGRRTICRTWRDADVRIVVAKARADPTEHAHLGLATLEGSAGRHDETVHPGRVVDFRTATMMALDAAAPDLAVVDAFGPVADGPFGIMGSHRPAEGRRVYAGRDALSVDVAVLADLGQPDPTRSPIVRTAAAWFGADLRAPEVVGDRGAPDGFRGPTPTVVHRALAGLGYPVYVYLGGRGQRFTPRMDAAAFPPLGPVSLLTRATRWLAQVPFGLRPPP
ncbi:DUF362 domain-containing protein [Iamia sp. SCSIO 61187]|uniref:DUF362 domain-containing protein n=1 Tax=Iamia sp. SCSIO 61187 TaxID=2722752 RepID=UPI001C62FD4E|nr:DUF362 domain-containing protein [Iamia sp. SCSIO 61187]QYG94533.1 DUF362 domain-containing protein [Iamia sp. SCSIO 61187]